MPPERTLQRAYSPQHKEQRVTDLMQAARALAARDGVRTVTLTAIATQAGVHVSAVRRYFESREEILLGLAEQGYADWAQALTDRIHGRDGLTSTDLAQAVTAALVERPLFCDLLTWHRASLTPRRRTRGDCALTNGGFRPTQLSEKATRFRSHGLDTPATGSC